VDFRPSYCSAVFLQFMKETNLVIVFLLSCSVGLNKFTSSRVVNVAWIVIGAAFAVQGEVHFLWHGFILQAISQIGECSKNVLGDWIMNGSDMKLDPLTYTMFMSPMCLMVLLVGNLFTWTDKTLHDLQIWWPYIIPNACLAFILNVTIAVLIKETSSITFIMTGLVKDVVIVLVSALVFKESVMAQQLIGFAICLSGVSMWSFSRAAPSSTVVVAFESACQKALFQRGNK